MKALYPTYYTLTFLILSLLLTNCANVENEKAFFDEKKEEVSEKSANKNNWEKPIFDNDSQSNIDIATQKLEELQDLILLLADKTIDTRFKDNIQSEIDNHFSSKKQINEAVQILQKYPAIDFTSLIKKPQTSQSPLTYQIANDSLSIIVSFVIHEEEKTFGNQKLKVKSLKIKEISQSR